MKYCDLDHAIQNILRLHDRELQRRQESGTHDHDDNSNDESNSVVVYIGKTDVRSAFWVLPLKRACWIWLVMAARNPINGKWQYFIDKCLPFGASISCSHFQRVSNGLKHIMQVRYKTKLMNYLDDFLFLALTIARCNMLLRTFLNICEEIGFPISLEKTEWAEEIMIFLGILLDGRHYVLSIPIDERDKAISLIQNLLDRKKVTVKELQALCGFLNFLGRAVFPSRAFTRRMYAKYGGKDFKPFANTKLKPHHHIRLDAEFKNDCKIWLNFLNDDKLAKVVNRPMVNLSQNLLADQIVFYSDASAREDLDFGCILNKSWIFGRWEDGFIDQYKPSIEYLKLFALVVGMITWQNKPELNNCRVIMFCDNQVVVAMINNISSSCSQCMYLLRLLVLNGLVHNRRVYATYMTSKNNVLADALSRLDLSHFHKNGKDMNPFPDKIRKEIWPVSRLWAKNPQE